MLDLIKAKPLSEGVLVTGKQAADCVLEIGAPDVDDFGRANEAEEDDFLADGVIALVAPARRRLLAESPAKE